MNIFKEFWLFVKEEKKWWLIPLVFILLVIGLGLIFAEKSVLAPLLYPLF